MQPMSLAAVAAAAALIYSFNTNVLIAVGAAADSVSTNVAKSPALSDDTRIRLFALERRVDGLEAKLKQSQGELRSARAALMIARYEMIATDEEEPELVREGR